MSIVTITLNGKKFQLSCIEGTEDNLLNLAIALNQRLEKIKKASPGATAELLLVILSLSLQEQILDMEKKIATLGSDKPDYEEEKFAETLSTIAGYLDNLAKKLAK